MALGSLTKEFPLAQVEATIRLASPGMQYSDFLERARATTHRDIPGLVVKRFLLERNGIILRDRFLSLVESEGLGTARMRKIMYGIWVLRDSRLRRFVLEVIANDRGLWRPNEIVRKSNASFFSQFLSPSTTPKVRSNIEYFLAETGIFNARNRSVHLELDDGWLSDSVNIAAEHESDAGLRHRMLANPIDYIVASGFNGLANATVEHLRNAPSTVQPEAENIEDDEVHVEPQRRLNDRRWNRAAPAASNRQRIQLQLDSVARERASQAHHHLEQLLASKITAAGLTPRYNPNIDLFFEAASGTVVAEIKSCHSNNVHSQIRRGVAQLLEYEYVYASLLTGPIQKLLVLEMPPPHERRWLIPFLQSIGISTVWKATNAGRFDTTLQLPEILSPVIR